MQNAQLYNPLAVLRPTSEPARYSLETFLRREQRANTRHEYYDGIIIKLPMAKAPHNIITMNVGTALNMAIRSAQKDYIVMGGQQMVYLPEYNFSLYPDVLVVVETPQFWDTNQVLLVNPILIVEVLSRGTQKYDKGDKFTEYKSLESFKEYVLIDQTKCFVETRFREAPKLWSEQPVKDLSETLFLKSLDVSIPVAEIYRHIQFKSKK